MLLRSRLLGWINEDHQIPEEVESLSFPLDIKTLFIVVFKEFILMFNFCVKI